MIPRDSTAVKLTAYFLIGVLAIAALCYFERQVYVLACIMGANWQCYGVPK